MFDDRLFDVIMEEMMNSFGPAVRTDEGSLAYNACCRIAEKLEEIYGDMDELADNMLPDTMDLNHLIRYGKERGIIYQEATSAIVKGVFTQEIEIGERFECNDYTYKVTELISGYNYKLECEEAGAGANGNLGALEPIDYIDEYAGGNITEILTAGVDDEDEEEFRGKVMNSLKVYAFSGNRADYKRICHEIDGLEACKPIRNEAGRIPIYVLGTDYTVPDWNLVNRMQAVLYPENGDGLVPICHVVQLYPATGVSINISCSLLFDTGYTIDSCRDKILTALENYMKGLREKWEDFDMNSITIRNSNISGIIMGVDGVADVSNITLNDASSVILDYKSVPVLGVVTFV